MHELVEVADLADPIALELAVVVAADVAPDGARVLGHLGRCTLLYGVSAKFVDHRFLPVNPAPAHELGACCRAPSLSGARAATSALDAHLASTAGATYFVEPVAPDAR